MVNVLTAEQVAAGEEGIYRGPDGRLTDTHSYPDEPKAKPCKFKTRDCRHKRRCARCRASRFSFPPAPAKRLPLNCLSGTVMPFGESKGQQFDTIPLGYLDWLSGQDWLYGQLRDRLTKYMLHPPIKQEVDSLFPLPDTQPDNFKPTHQRREPMPKTPEQPQPDLEPEEVSDVNFKRSMWKKFKGQIPTELWLEAATLLVVLEQMSDPNDLFELDFARIGRLCQELPDAKGKITKAYKACRERLRSTPAEQGPDIYKQNDRYRAIGCWPNKPK